MSGGLKGHHEVAGNDLSKQRTISDVGAISFRHREVNSKGVPPGRTHLHGDITVCMTPVAQSAQAGVQAGGAGVVAVQALVERHVFCLGNPQANGAVQPQGFCGMDRDFNLNERWYEVERPIRKSLRTNLTPLLAKILGANQASNLPSIHICLHSMLAM